MADIDGRKKILAAASLLRGLFLLKSVDKFVSGVAKEAHLTSEVRLSREIDSLEIDRPKLDRILKLVEKNPVTDESDELQVPVEFEDLGKSARLKAIEDGFRKVDADSENFDDKSLALPGLEKFEQKMFHFLDEIK